MHREPLLEVTNTAIYGLITGRFAARLAIYEDAIELVQRRGAVGVDHQRVRYEQVAQVMLRRGWLFSDLVIETRGGGRLEAHGLSHHDAVAARELIEQRMQEHQRT